MSRYLLHILLFPSLCCIAAFSFGQQAQAPLVSLSRYSFPGSQQDGMLCQLLTDRVDQYALNLTGPQAKLFLLKGSAIYLSKQGRKYFRKAERASFNVTGSLNHKIAFERIFTLLKDGFASNGVIAHRGAWKNTGLPQNSVASLQAAIFLGCAGSEFDIQCTADSVLVINHDPAYEGMPIERTAYPELLKYPLKNGETLPTLEDYLKAGIRQQRTRLIAEIKPSVVDKAHVLYSAESTVKMVQRLQAQAWVVYISFDYDALKEVLRLEPGAMTMYLNGDKDPGQLKEDGILGMDYNEAVYHRELSWIANARQAGLQVNVWTVDTVPEMEYFQDRNVEYITTNEPEILFSLLPKLP